jgi:hypothetical protein
MTYRLKESNFHNGNQSSGWWNRSDLDEVSGMPSEWDTRYNPEGFHWFVANSDRQYQHKLIKEYSRDKIVIDLGAGAGYAGINAFKHGAKFVYFVEYDPQASLMLERALEKIGFINKWQYQVINKDIERLTIEDFAGPIPEVVYSEFYGPCIFDEGFGPYTKHLDTLFPDLYYAPECQAMDVRTWDTDYSVPPWPYKRPELIESFKVKYSNSVWNAQALPDYDPMPTPKPHTTHGMFYYNANTKELIDSVTVVTTTPEQMIGFFPIEYGCHHDYFFENDPRIGWWVEEPGTYVVTMDVANALQGMPRIIYPGESSNGG